MATETSSNPVEKTPLSASSTVTKASVEAQEIAQQGNWMCHVKQYAEAVKYFTDAIRLDPKEVRFYGNRAACYEILGNYELALEDANMALRISPNWIKGYFRRASALEGLGRYSESQSTLEDLLRLSPNCGEATVCRLKVMTKQLMSYGFPLERAQAAVLYYGSVQRARQCLAATRSVSSGALSDVFDSDDDEALSCGATFANTDSKSAHAGLTGADTVARPSDLSDLSAAEHNSKSADVAEQQSYCGKARAVSTNTTLSSSAASVGAVTPPAFSAVAANAPASEPWQVSQRRAKATPPPAQSSAERVNSASRCSQSPPVCDPLLDPRNPLKWDTLWVGNLRPNTSEKLVVDIFSRYGKIKNTRMILDKHCVFITYNDWRSAGDAIKAQQGAQINKQKVLIKFPDRALENAQKLTSASKQQQQQSRAHQPVVLRKKK